MHTKNDEQAVNSRELSATRIESIEDLLRSRGFFDTPDRENTEAAEVLVG